MNVQYCLFWEEGGVWVYWNTCKPTIRELEMMMNFFI